MLLLPFQSGLSCLLVPSVFGFTWQFNPCEIPADEGDLAQKVLELVNQERSSRGLPILQPNSTLSWMAGEYCCEMIDNGYFGHANPYMNETEEESLQRRAKAANYVHYRKIGENLACGFYSPEEVVLGWMASPAHRDNILEPDFCEIGIGVRIGGVQGIYWAQEFGQPLSCDPL